jgi:hypothetical protein
MRGIATLAAVLLAAVPLPAAASTVDVTFDRAVATAPFTFPFDFGTRPLGKISLAAFTLCFKQPASPQSSCDASGMVAVQEPLAAPFYNGGFFREVIATGVKTKVNLPITVQAGQRLVSLSQWVTDRTGAVDDSLVLRGTPTGGVADQITLDFSGDGMNPGPCFPASDALCLNNDRFKVQSQFITSTAASGAAGAVGLTGDTGYLWFFNPSNVEAVVKVLNACSFNNRYWVFAGGLTDVRTVITVTDTQRNAVRTYINPQGTPYQPIQDTSAFATCP